MSVDQADDLLTPKEAAAFLKVSTVTIKRYLKQGRLPAYHIGPRAIRIRRQDLQRVLHPAPRQEVNMTPEQARSKTPPAHELHRRQILAKEIMTLREKNDIQPLTTADLVTQAREETTWYGRRR